MNKISESKLENNFISELPADKEQKNFPRQVSEACFSYAEPKKTRKPKLIIVSEDMLNTLGISDSNSELFLKIVTGNELIPSSKPYAMCYGGHQFGGWAGQLGDGRAINLTQIEHNNRNWTLQLKGAGPTPYSRTADGFAVLRSSVREFLCSEAMFHLGISSTRALSLSLTGDEVLRDVLYDGNPAYEKGAVVCRVSESFIRFGNFQIFASRQDFTNLEKLANYTIKHHYSHLGEPSKETYLAFFNEVCMRSAKTIIDWQRVGFVHGVMNTDNMSILGQTIDYGPYGWLENFDQDWTPNTTDSQHRRYRFGSQGSIALWNLTQLANALYPLIEDVPALQEVLEDFKDIYIRDYHFMLNKKLGIPTFEDKDIELSKELFGLLTSTETDMTIFYRNLADIDFEKLEEHISAIKKASYVSYEIFEANRENWKTWLNKYSQRLEKETDTITERKEMMNAVNPKYVLRNYMAQLAIDEVDKGNDELIKELHNLLKRPYDEQSEMEKWFVKRPDWAKNRVGCSQLSCSS